MYICIVIYIYIYNRMPTCILLCIIYNVLFVQSTLLPLECIIIWWMYAYKNSTYQIYMPFQFCNQRCVCLKPSYRICIKLNQILLLPTTQGVSKPIAATVCLINYICCQLHWKLHLPLYLVRFCMCPLINISQTLVCETWRRIKWYTEQTRHQKRESLLFKFVVLLWILCVAIILPLPKSHSSSHREKSFGLLIIKIMHNIVFVCSTIFH